MEITVAILTLAGAAVGAIISLIISKKSNYISATTQSRIEWIKILRNLSADFINSCHDNNNVTNEANELLTKIRIHMNPVGTIDKNIIRSAESVLKSNNTDDFEIQIKAYLKAEWERVKYESTGKTYTNHMFTSKYNDIINNTEEIAMGTKKDMNVETKKGYQDHIHFFMSIIKLATALGAAVIVLAVALAAFETVFDCCTFSEIITKLKDAI